MIGLIGLLTTVLPEAVHFFAGKDDKATKALDIATTVVKKLAGTDDPNQAVQIVGASPDLQLKLREELMADSHWASNMQYQNTFQARDMYIKTSHEASDKIAQQIMTNNLGYVALLVLINIAIALWVPQKYMVAVAGVSNLLGVIINSLLKERQDVVNFHFGSSVGSKLKDVGGMSGAAKP